MIVGSNSTLNLDADIKVKIKIQNFYGIEINDFAVSVARTAMWIAESQMWAESQNIIYSRDDFLPLDSNDSIFEGNALRMDWSEIVEPYDVNYIMGNPPFVGQSYRSNEQKQDMIDIFGKGSRETKQDYVICWYKKSLDYVSDYKNSSVKCAFVSTNSICQGECVPTFWKDMINAGVEIQFARRTFIWTNEAKNKAAVHCVIVGYSFHKINNIKELYDGGKLTKCDHINPYLVPEEDIWISSRPKRPKDKSKMTTGSPATDDGQLFLSPEEAKTMSKEYPILSKYIRPFIGAHEFLHDLNERTRYCLWFADVGDELPKIIKADHMKDRFQHIKEKRLSSSASRIKKAAETPWLFAQNRQPDTEYLVIPRHSSENREYIPIGFMYPKTIAGDATTIVYDATLEDFAILESSLHVAWMKTVAGRLKSDYRYSSSVYYNFPMPKLTNELKEKLEKSAEGILNARANHPSLSLADMYKELLMPSDLRDAYRKNDKLILQAYGLNKDATDQDILKVLFKMYNNKDND
ncbi:DNA methyltransferase [Ligilactobacillus salivarius]|uniref:DNA methyltransferase n=1 Tax=Ligilactobacillus salivarius TaxID=1624 RepID=UPI002989A62C|nr:DNA methyltransferase [Ligilactobacillus salivarius]